MSSWGTRRMHFFRWHDRTAPHTRLPVRRPRGALSSAGLIQAYDDRGGRKWSFALTNPSSSDLYVDASGTLYVSENTGTLRAIDREGKERWTAKLPEAGATPVPGRDGTVYVECVNGSLYALTGPTP